MNPMKTNLRVNHQRYTMKRSKVSRGQLTNIQPSTLFLERGKNQSLTRLTDFDILTRPTDFKILILPTDSEVLTLPTEFSEKNEKVHEPEVNPDPESSSSDSSEISSLDSRAKKKKIRKKKRRKHRKDESLDPYLSGDYDSSDDR